MVIMLVSSGPDRGSIPGVSMLTPSGPDRGSIPGQVKPTTITLPFVSSPLNTQH
jgi:hypothetical protein